MAENEITATEQQPTPPAETPAAEVPQEQPKPQEFKIADHPAYKELQRRYQKQFDANERMSKDMTDLKTTVEYLTSSTQALVKTNLGEEKAAVLDEQLKTAKTEAQRKEVSRAAIEFTQKQSDLLFEVLQTSGIDPNTIKWPTEAQSVEEWYGSAREQVINAISGQQKKYVKAVETALKNVDKAAEEKAKKIAQATLKEAGVGRIDTSKGSATPGLQKLAGMDPKSKEFAELIKLAEAGKLKEI